MKHLDCIVCRHNNTEFTLCSTKPELKPTNTKTEQLAYKCVIYGYKLLYLLIQ